MARSGACFGKAVAADGAAVGGDVYSAIRTLARCRPSCRREYGDRDGA